MSRKTDLEWCWKCKCWGDETPLDDHTASPVIAVRDAYDLGIIRGLQAAGRLELNDVDCPTAGHAVGGAWHQIACRDEARRRMKRLRGTDGQKSRPR